MPCFNENDYILESINELKDFMKKNVINLLADKVVFCIIDDGSTDNTWEKLKNINNNEDDQFSYILTKLDNNYGHQSALLAGLNEIVESVDCAISIDADLEHDINIIPEFINKFNKKYEIVLGIRKNRKGDRLLKKISSNLFYFLAHISGSNLKKNHADYRLLSKNVIYKIIENKGRNLFLRGIVNNLNFRKTEVMFDVKVNKDRKSRYSIIKMINLAFDSLTLTGRTPLRIMSVIGFLMIIFSLLMIIYILFMKFTYQDVVPGWASSVLPIYLIGGINISAIALVGEYVGKIYDNIIEKPAFVIEEKIIK